MHTEKCTDLQSTVQRVFFKGIHLCNQKRRWNFKGLKKTNESRKEVVLGIIMQGVDRKESKNACEIVGG